MSHSKSRSSIQNTEPQEPKKSIIDTLLNRHRSRLAQHQVGTERKTNSALSLFENRISMSVSEFAVHIGVSIRTAERMLKRGDIHHKRVGRRVLIPMSAIEAWLNRKD